MSLFIGALAYPGDGALVEQAKLGTLAGSLLSALAGYALLRFAPTSAEDQHDSDDAAELFAADQP
jgi:NhaA family Na+:H+ antiporter